MAGSKVSIDGLADAVMENLNEYARASAEDVKAAVRKAGNIVRDEIKGTAPKDTGAYAKSWSLAHLLEYGHAKRGGGRVSAKPHIASAEQKGVEELEKNIERALRG